MKIKTTLDLSINKVSVVGLLVAVQHCWVKEQECSDRLDC